MEETGGVDIPEAGHRLLHDPADGASREPLHGRLLLQIAHVQAEHLHDDEVHAVVVSRGDHLRDVGPSLQPEEDLLLEDHPPIRPVALLPQLRLDGHLLPLVQVQRLVDLAVAALSNQSPDHPPAAEELLWPHQRRLRRAFHFRQEACLDGPAAEERLGSIFFGGGRRSRSRLGQVSIIQWFSRSHSQTGQ